MGARILLFDIDGTLVTTGGVGRRAMRRAFGEVCGREDALDSLRFGGMTDWGIVRQGFAIAGKEASDADIQGLLDTYTGILEREIAAATGCLVHPGVEAVLSAVEGRNGVAMGLATGNIKNGARLKLSKVGLWQRFGFGGYGCDHEIRSELLMAGALRGAEILGVSVEACEIIVIGDTPKDVTAATAIGARCVAVATGTYDRASLEQTAADLVVSDLTDGAVVPALLG